MASKKRQTRTYLQLCRAAIQASLSAVDSFNRVYGEYKTETTFILLSNAWELLAKAVLVKNGKSLSKDKTGKEKISCEKAINKLLNIKAIEKNQVELLQQIISLRNQCTHSVLPDVPEAIQHHLLFFGCKFFKELAEKHFPSDAKVLERNYLSISFDKETTYAAQIKQMVSKLRRAKTSSEKELVWLLERGVRFIESENYISQAEFEKLYKSKKKIMPHLKVGSYIGAADMIRIVPVEAPSNFGADINLRKGSKRQADSLPVVIKKTEVETDYPFLTRDIAEKIGKDINFVAKAMGDLKIKGDKELHQAIPTSKSGAVQRYSQAALARLKKHLEANPNYYPYHKKDKGIAQLALRP